MVKISQVLIIPGSVKSTFVLSREDSPGPCELDILPPPVFSTTVVPHSYKYGHWMYFHSLSNLSLAICKILLQKKFKQTPVPG